MATLILFLWLNLLCYNFVTSCLRNKALLTAFSHRIFKHQAIVT